MVPRIEGVANSLERRLVSWLHMYEQVAHKEIKRLDPFGSEVRRSKHKEIRVDSLEEACDIDLNHPRERVKGGDIGSPITGAPDLNTKWW